MSQKIRLIQLLLFITVCVASFSQHNSIIASHGNTSVCNNVLIDWSIGEPIIGTQTPNSFLITQGFQQTFYLKNNNPETSTLQLNLYPNPATTQLFAQLLRTNSNEFYYSVYNILGQLVESNISNQNPTQINISTYSSGIYILYFWDKNNKLIGHNNFVKL